MAVEVNFEDVYAGLLQRLLASRLREVNGRTGAGVRLLPAAESFVLDLSDQRLPVPGLRRTYARTAAAEVAWFLMGSRDVTWLRKYAPIWDKFVEEDGVTVDSAYGYRWRNHFGRDQLGDAIRALVNDPSDRRVFVSAWDPAQDGLGRAAKNVPCPVGFTLSIVDNHLNSSLLIRSSDVFVGLPYDVMGHAILMDCVASEIRERRRHGTMGRLLLGTMHVTLAHPHLYECHWEMAKVCVDGPRLGQPNTQLLGWASYDVCAKPEAFVDGYKQLHPWTAQPSLPNFKPEVVQ